MASPVARAVLTSRSWSSAVSGSWRRVKRSLSSKALLYRTYYNDALDLRLQDSPEASPALDTHLTGANPSAVPITETIGADGPVCHWNAYPLPRWAGFRVYPAPRGKYIRGSRDMPEEGLLPIGSAGGSGNPDLRSAASTTSEAIAFLKQGLYIDPHLLVEILKRCSKQRDLVAARQLHECIIQSGMDRSQHVMNSLLNVYIRCGRLQDARQVFDSLHLKDVVSWTMMIAGYAETNHPDVAMKLFTQMRQSRVQPNDITCLSVLRAFGTPSALKWGKELHTLIKQMGLDGNVRVGTALIQMYAKCGSITDSKQVFDSLTNRDTVMWNVMIGVCAESGCGVEAYRLFLQMKRDGFKPNLVTYVSILNASASNGALEWLKEVHTHARREGLALDLRVGNALIHMYAKSGSFNDAQLVFGSMEKRDEVTWTTMIGACAESGRGSEAYRLFLQMEREGFTPDAITYMSILNPNASTGALNWVKEIHTHSRRAGLESDIRVGNALVHMYAKSGSLDNARQVFDRIRTRDLTTWNIMIGAYAETGCHDEAYRLFIRMRQDVFKPDAITYVSILNAAASAGALEWVKEVHRHALRAGLESDLRVGNAFVHMYAKSGSIGEARLIFDRMGRRDVVTWNIMMGGLAQHGCAHEALELFRKMIPESVQPDETSLVAVLSACCHAGLLDDGRKIFLRMEEEYRIEPTVVHYTCMVDLLGRAGRLEEAVGFIRGMPVEPNEVTWKALLGACRTYGNVELGELAAEEALKLAPKDASVYVLLSNIYAALGMWEKVASVRKQMQESGVAKEPGRSWIEVDNKVHEFGVGDTSHPEAKAIYAELNSLTERLKVEGYVPDTQIVLRNIDEEDKELALCSHSEKLAIAYGLMHTPSEEPIRVYKNLRVCSDCHRATRFISKVTEREIIARDANRFHHFKDGVCSCGDYW